MLEQTNRENLYPNFFLFFRTIFLPSPTKKFFFFLKMNSSNFQQFFGIVAANKKAEESKKGLPSTVACFGGKGAFITGVNFTRPSFFCSKKGFWAVLRRFHVRIRFFPEEGWRHKGNGASKTGKNYCNFARNAIPVPQGRSAFPAATFKHFRFILQNVFGRRQLYEGDFWLLYRMDVVCFAFFLLLFFSSLGWRLKRKEIF